MIMSSNRAIGMTLIRDMFIFQHDNASVHTARSVKDFIKDVGITVMEWPANSPDLNPFEHVWGCIHKAGVGRVSTASLRGRWMSFGKEFRRSGQKSLLTIYLQELYASMQQRRRYKVLRRHLEACIDGHDENQKNVFIWSVAPFPGR